MIKNTTLTKYLTYGSLSHKHTTTRRTMSLPVIRVTIGMSRHEFGDSSTASTLIDECANKVTANTDVCITLVDPDTLDFDKYIFTYDINSTRSPKAWLLNNVGWALTTKKSKLKGSKFFPKFTASVLGAIHSH